MSLVSGWCNGQSPRHVDHPQGCRSSGCTCWCHGPVASFPVPELTEYKGMFIWVCDCGESGSHVQALYAKIGRTAHMKKHGVDPKSNLMIGSES